MKHATKMLCLVALAILIVAQPGGADDRDLLRSVTAPPNVLLILDSGASMTHDSETNSVNFITGGDADGRFADFHKSWYALSDDWETALQRGSKLDQAKSALKTVFDTGFDFNWGFSYYEKSQITIGYLNYIYVVKDLVDTDGDGVDDTSQGAMLDGTIAGTPMRFGDFTEQRTNSQIDPFFPVRYGRHGDQIYVEAVDPFGDNTTYTSEDATPTDFDRRLVSYLVDSGDIATARQLGSPSAGDMWYYPAYDYSALPSTVQDGLEGVTPWITYAENAGFDTTDDHWRELVWGDVQPYLDAAQIGSRTMYIKEEYQIFNPLGQGRWGACDALDGCADPKITEIEYAQHYVLYDHDYHDESGNFSNTLSSLDYTGSADCQGYLDYGNSKSPIVPPAQPDALGATADTEWWIESFLEPQTSPIFYFPENADEFLPAVREDYIPMTETVAAIGRRPIKDTVNEAKFYFNNTIADWNDPLAGCRQNFLILITDGMETCAGGQAICSAADNFPGAIYTIYLGTENNAQDISGLDEVECIATRSGGAYFTAGSEDELVEALLSIGRAIEERTRGFSSPMVPSVEASTRQTAYVSTFTPFQQRSIWQGHLRAYPIDPITGVVANLDENTGTPTVSKAQWDAGDILAVRDFSTSDPRQMFFGLEVDNGSGVMVPVRRSFDYPGYDSGSFSLREELYPLLWPGYPVPADYDSESEIDDRVPLRQVIDFMRGEQFGTDADVDGNDVPLRHITYETPDPSPGDPHPDPVPVWSSSYLWCGPAGDVDAGDPFNTCNSPDLEVLGIEKLGDIFHSVPQRMSSPNCFSCYLSDYQNYRGFLANHRERRTVMFAGADDGAMHAFDAGLWDGSYAEPQTDAGTGRELFAWMPTSVMDTFPGLRDAENHAYTVDGTSIVYDVFIDRVLAGGSAQPGDREWRTLLVWGQRRGGQSYVALDVTQPDTYTVSDGHYNTDLGGTVAFTTETVTDVDGNVLYTWDRLDPTVVSPDSSRDPLCADGTAAGCTGEWPAFRWEFVDTSDEDPASDPADSIYNPGETAPDLGYTWSRPLIGFVNTSTGVHSVAFFGGGFSDGGVHADNENISGNWIYGLDIETGDILFKQRVDGMVPGDVQALDINLDGFIEKLYFGTTDGNVYRVDLTASGTVDGGTGRVTNWVPEKIFDGPEVTVDGDEYHQNFFTRPAVVPISFNSDGTANVAIAIGSGNRDGIFELNPEPHRFYVFNEPASGDAAVTESDLQELDLDSADQTDDFLASTTVSGWYLKLYESARSDNWEKVNTNPLVLDYYVIFSTFRPVENITVIEGTCLRGGSARTYVVGLTNANPRPGQERYQDLGDDTAMVSDPVVYLGADGEVHVIQATDNLELEEPIASFAAPVRMVNWREE